MQIMQFQSLHKSSCHARSLLKFGFASQTLAAGVVSAGIHVIATVTFASISTNDDSADGRTFDRDNHKDHRDHQRRRRQRDNDIVHDIDDQRLSKIIYCCYYYYYYYYYY